MRGITTAPTATSTTATCPGWVPYWTALRRTPLSMWNDDVSDWAAALTYYAILALLPALLVTVGTIGMVSPATTDALTTHVIAWAPAQSGTALHQVLGRTTGNRSTALTLVVAGCASSLWSASSYLAVFRRALHRMHGTKAPPPTWSTVPRILLTAAVLLVLLIASALVLLLTGTLTVLVGEWLGLGQAGTQVWLVLKWPVLLGLAAMIVFVLFRTCPASTRRRAYAVAGGVLAAVMWLTASVGFTVYASNVGTYSRLYGSLAGIVVFLVWLWVSNLSLLAGAQFAVELGRVAVRPGKATVPNPRAEQSEQAKPPSNAVS